MDSNLSSWFRISTIFLALLLTTLPRAAHSKCTSNDELCWPSAQAWAAFNRSVDGRLIDVRPPASPCHDPNYDEQACKEVQRNWNRPFWRTDQPGAMERTSWESLGDQRCLISSNRSTTCFQGRVPVYAVDVNRNSQIQTAVTFAAKHNLRLVIRNTGHDFLGRSTAVGALSIWVHHLQSIRFDDSFKAGQCRGARTEGAVTVGAGVQWEELSRQAYLRKLVLPGGGCPSVGAAGGYPQGGGHSFVGPALGMAADNILQFEVVTADGKLVRANECENRDLFWALRGGGGGTFGVVVSATHRTHPAFESLVYSPHNFTASSSSSFLALLTFFTRLSPALSDAGWSGYFLSTSRSLTLTFLLPNGSVSSASASMEPLFKYARENGIEVQGQFQTYPSYWDWHLVPCGGKSSCVDLDVLGVSSVFSSRLIPRSLFLHDQDPLPKAMLYATEKLQVSPLVTILAGGKMTEVQDNAVNPAYRKALWFVTQPLFWRDNATLAEMKAAADLVTESNKAFIDLTPGSGTYVNEADYNEPNWQQSFFGDNYKRLLSIKRKVDPHNVFTCHHCVGSEFI